MMMKDIYDIQDVRLFFNELFLEGVNAHPDEDFTQYINMDTGEDSYSPKEAALRNLLMSKSFEICKISGVDIYDLMQEIFLERTGLNKFIFLPSQIDKL